ncbi:YadA-like family protein, partial [Escherichia coli]|nr:YadA-like family protein [Escherichia coli]
MSKKFSKTILSSAVAGLLMMSSGAMAANETKVVGNYTIEFTNPDSAKIYKTGQSNNDENVLQVNTETGTISLINKKEVNAAISEFQKSAAYSEFKQQYPSVPEEQINAIVAQQIGELHRYSINTPLLKSDNLTNITGDEIDAINNNIVKVKDVITSKTAADYNQAVSNGMSSEAALAAASSANGGGAMLHEFSRIGTNITNNTKAIQSNSRQLQEHNARLNDHQRQIRENHEEMKRAAAQSAALAGLFQPYSVGKFNATAALGGYSDKQAVAVGVGYRFNEQTAAKAGIAASDGDVSY